MYCKPTIFFSRNATFEETRETNLETDFQLVLKPHSLVKCTFWTKDIQETKTKKKGKISWKIGLNSTDSFSKVETGVFNKCFKTCYTSGLFIFNGFQKTIINCDIYYGGWFDKILRIWSPLAFAKRDDNPADWLDLIHLIEEILGSP